LRKAAIFRLFQCLFGANQQMSSGQVITFYSYKGGTGRSMAVANVGCILASRGQRVLLVDWDLEAPGLHRFFIDPRQTASLSSGLIDLFVAFLDVAGNPLTCGVKYQDVRDICAAVTWQTYVSPTSTPGVSLLTAGRIDASYNETVRSFSWEKLFRLAPSLIPALADEWAADFDYVLVDSRTGVTDTGAICTSLVPEKLVIVFTPAMQSLSGGLVIAERAVEYRRHSVDLRPLGIFPLPSRVDLSETTRRHLWRYGDQQGFNGYQSMFESMLGRVYGTDCSLQEYFDSVEIPHCAYYAFGEEIAATRGGNVSSSLAAAYERFTDRLIGSGAPWAD
jgi:eukaryotic-like serine/threonine-protein kinase